MDCQFLITANLPDGTSVSLPFGGWSTLEDVRQRLLLQPALADKVKDLRKIELQFTLPGAPTKSQPNVRSLPSLPLSPPVPAASKVDNTPKRSPILSAKPAQYPIVTSQSPGTSRPLPISPAARKQSVSPSASPKQPSPRTFFKRRSRSYCHEDLSDVIIAPLAKMEANSQPVSPQFIGLPKPRDTTLSITTSSAVSPLDTILPALEVSSPKAESSLSARPRSFNWSLLPTKRVPMCCINSSVVAEAKMTDYASLKTLGVQNFQFSAESLLFAQTISHLARQVQTSGWTDLDVPPASICRDPIPYWFPKDEYSVIVRGSVIRSDSSITIPVNETAASLLQRLIGQPLNPSSFVLKITGLQEFVYDNSIALHQLDYVRQCLKTRATPEFTVMLRTTPLNEGLSAIHRAASSQLNSYVLQEPFLGSTPIEVSCCSCGAIDKGFEVKIVALENFPVELCSTLFDLASTYDSTAYERLKGVSVEKSRDTLRDAGIQLFVDVKLLNGDYIAESLRSSVRSTPMWVEWLKSSLLWSQLPRETRLCFQVLAIRPTFSKSKAAVLGHLQFALFDKQGFLKAGKHKLKMWLGDAPLPTHLGSAPVGENPLPDQPTLHFEIETPPNGIYVCHDVATQPIRARPLQLPMPDKNVVDKITRLCTIDPMQRLDSQEKQMVWTHRYWLQGARVQNSLVRLAESTDWFDPSAVRELHYFVSNWDPIHPAEAVELLSWQFPDTVLRQFAIKSLKSLSDLDLVPLLLQLVHILEYETWIDSDLARFLFERALRNRTIVGYRFFWRVLSSVTPQNMLRFGAFLECYMQNCGDQLPRLMYQKQVFTALKNTAQQVASASGKSRRLSILQNELQALASFSRPLVMPHQPTLSSQRLVVEKCKFMDSAATPLWLVFENVDTSSTNYNSFAIIFKVGDDLRQDILILQMLQLMDSKWKKEGLDLFMTVYGCVATGPKEGIIEAVPNSTTMGRIQKEFGGATAAFSKEPLSAWLLSANPTVKDVADAVQHLTGSLAAYCVASFLLGLADRHNDNIMISKAGNFFHIDFAHVLGFYLSYAGIYQRENAPFVLTEELIEAIGGANSRNFEKFCELCCTAYSIRLIGFAMAYLASAPPILDTASDSTTDIIRMNALEFIRLFKLMVTSGLPQLQAKPDSGKGLQYLHLAFAMDLSAAEASKKFEQLIYESRSNLKTQLNFFFHILAH